MTCKYCKTDIAGRAKTYKKKTYHWNCYNRLMGVQQRNQYSVANTYRG